MKLLEFLKLTEMPVRDFYADDSIDAPSSNWNPRDARMVTSPKIEQLARQRIKTAVPIDMVFMDIGDIYSQWETPEGDMSKQFHRMLDQYSGAMTPQDFQRAFGSAIGTTNDGITAVFFSNTQDQRNKIGMTPWIMVHRMSHSLLDAAVNGQLGDVAKLNVAPFRDVTDEYLTMRSAMTGKMAGGEEPVEVLTQFLHNGEIKLARVQERYNEDEILLTNGNEVVSSPPDHPDDPEPFDEEMEDLEDQLNASANIIVNAAIGMVVVAP